MKHILSVSENGFQEGIWFQG